MLALLFFCLVLLGVGAAQVDPWVGTFKNDDITVTLRREGAGYAGTVRIGGADLPLTAQRDGAGLKGTFRVEEQSYPFTATLDGDVMVLDSEGTKHTLRRAATGRPNPLAGGTTATKPTAGQAKTPSLDGWKTFKHPLGPFIRHPADWTARMEEEALLLLPPGQSQPNQSEVILVAGEDAQGVTDPRSPQVTQVLDAYITENLNPAFRRKGSPQPATAGNGKGVLHVYEAPGVDGKPFQCRVYTTILKNYAISLLALMPADRMTQREPLLVQMFSTLNMGAAEVDQALVGTWTKVSETIIDSASSGGRRPGDASLVGNTQTRVQLNGDGSALARVTSQTLASGSGVFVESNSDDRYDGTWAASGGRLIIVWSDGSSVEAAYRIDGDRAILTMNGREIVYQRG